MTRKRWCVLTLALLLGTLLLIITAVVLVDPFEIYHQATAFIPPITNGTQSYSNAGIAKNYSYDSVIIGSSMTENFTPSQLNALLGGCFVKLCINGGSSFNHKQMMDIAFSTHDVRRVLYGMDVDALTYFYTTPKAEMPDYLYDDNLFNDVHYWFNKTVLAKYIPLCLRSLGQTDPTLRDRMYNWGDLYAYGEEAVLSQNPFTPGHVDQSPPQESPQLSQQSKLNVEYNILPYLREHPDTTFYFFFPPYSLLYWHAFYASGDLGYHLTQKEALVRELLTFDNVSVFDFQADMAWITDLSNYIDARHYGPWVNDAIAEAIADGHSRVTSLSIVQQNDAALRDACESLALCAQWPY